jgi:hypothetical protein
MSNAASSTTSRDSVALLSNGSLERLASGREQLPPSNSPSDRLFHPGDVVLPASGSIDATSDVMFDPQGNIARHLASSVRSSTRSSVNAMLGMLTYNSNNSGCFSGASSTCLDDKSENATQHTDNDQDEDDIE